ncbi:MAG: DUF58 domain-containing protein [Eubacteriales bacterium]|nr:DUF58 domain-containing protein [Eubacteriales bacterium]
MSLVWLVLCAGLVALLQGALFRRVGLKRLRYERRFSVPAAFAGDEAEMIETLVNRSRLPVPWLRVQSRVPAALRFGTHAAGEMYHRSCFYVRPRSRLVRRHKVLLTKRGCYRAGSVALTSGDLLGASCGESERETGAMILAYPRPMAEENLPLPCSRFLGELLVRRFIEPDPFLMSGVRPYRPGDSQRDVHWAATARLRELMVKTYDFSADPHLLVVLNVQRSENQWADLTEAESAAIEEGVSIAAALCLRAIDQGAEAGFAANTDLETDGAPALLAPARSEEQKRALLTLMARLTLRMRMNFYAYLDALPRGVTDVLVLSCYESRRVSEALERLRLSGVRVQLYRLRGGVKSDEEA